MHFFLKELLATINQILLEDHFRAGFAECTDLPRFRERSPNSTSTEVHIIRLIIFKILYFIVLFCCFADKNNVGIHLCLPLQKF